MKQGVGYFKLILALSVVRAYIYQSFPNIFEN